MSDPGTPVTCERHGGSHAAFVCQHVARGAGKGFVFGDADDPRPDAWCHLCDAVLMERDGEWDDESEAFAGITMLCAGCYDEARARNEGSGDLPPGYLSMLAQLVKVYGDREPEITWRDDIEAPEGWIDPTYSVKVFANEEPVPHWHLVGLGLSELYDKVFEDDDVSGFGFELTLRAPRGREDEPPGWSYRLLHSLAQHVLRGGGLFEAGSLVNVSGLISPALPGLALVLDPALGRRQTVHGRVDFLQCVGLTTQEMEAVRVGRVQDAGQAVLSHDRLALTDPSRRSWFS